MRIQGVQVVLHRVVDADVDHLEAGALHHHRHQVLADVMDVALDGADHHLADGLGPGLRQQGAQDGHAGLHGVGRHQHFGNEEDAVAKVDADDGHAIDQGLAQSLLGRPAAIQQNAHALVDLFGQAIVEVVVHLLHELLIIQGGKIQGVVTQIRHASPQVDRGTRAKRAQAYSRLTKPVVVKATFACRKTTKPSVLPPFHAPHGPFRRQQESGGKSMRAAAGLE